ncbi:hypothetical protein [Actinoallomurus sp. NPDC050550]|uniref:hypothetical protein n=1 Tax=Actinoallomurus sp. NPDC050550 TaxID=3154937 RepID=UPI0033F07746
MGRETTGGAVARHLHELRDWLDAAGFTATVETPRGGMPYVRVGNRHAPVLCEKIRIDRYRVDGDALWFFYSWGDPICPAQETSRAAQEITNVLGNR